MGLLFMGREFFSERQDEHSNSAVKHSVQHMSFQGKHHSLKRVCSPCIIFWTNIYLELSASCCIQDITFLMNFYEHF